MELKIVKDLVIPTAQRGGAKGSQYFPKEVQEAVDKLEVGQGFVIPFISADEKGRKTQRGAVKWRIGNHLDGKTWTDENPRPEFAVGIIADSKDKKGNLEPGGVAVKRTA